ncbi:MAG TPA: hypothetical protein PKJ24_06700 [Prolixibacteraceae bacterium]|nr:hypothetical protein [Prolixibacteraceae bacterium]
MKKLKVSALCVMALFFISVFTACEPYRTSTTVPQPVYEPPRWAPPVYAGTRYYYIPDIECYYDIHTREFIFLDHARWVYSPALPYFYRDFDLDNCFIVIVNSRIYQPWMHHQYYVSHFPRYYYRDYYDHSNIPWVRGYDENFRKAVYWGENERHRARSWDDQNLRDNRQFRYSREDRQQQVTPDTRTTTGTGREVIAPPVNEPNHALPPIRTRKPDQEATGVEGTPGPPANPQGPPATTETPESRRSTGTNYYGRPIGQPVKVERQMRNQSETGSPGDSKNESSETKRRSNSGRR